MTHMIDAKGLHYKELNQRIHDAIALGSKRIRLKNVLGQRYIGAGPIGAGVTIEVEGIPGEDLGFVMQEGRIIVYGHGQNSIGNTMDSGEIYVHGLAGDALAYGMRGGKIFIRDDVGYRVGIHMKAYQEKSPTVVIGGTTGDFLGEYMAGGTLLVLNKNNVSYGAVGKAEGTLATGMHGGTIYIFAAQVEDYQLGIGASFAHVDEKERIKIRHLVEEYAKAFSSNVDELYERELVKIVPLGSRPFGGFYAPAYPSDTGLKPQHLERTSPCASACPIGIPTGKFLKHIRDNDIEQAIALIDEYTPFRNSCCGHICPHLCMDSCTRGKLDFPIKSAELAKRYKIDRGCDIQEKKQAKIAIIGGGPAGLSAAYFLARKGYSITIYEADQEIGGKMYQVISRSRLPMEELQWDLKRIKDMGITVKLNSTIDQDDFQKIMQDFDRVILAVGAQKGALPPVKGIENASIGIDFLKAYNRGEINTIGRQVVVLGAGDAAIDGIEAALELGVEASKIQVLDIKKPSGNKEELKRLKEKGVTFHYPVFAQELTDEGVILAKDSYGNPLSFESDQVLVFTSEKPQLDFLPDNIAANIQNNGFLRSEKQTCRLEEQKVYYVGDVGGLKLVAENIANARLCAEELHAEMQGLETVLEDLQAETLSLDPHKCAPLENEEDLEPFERCLHCGVCIQCDECVNACPRGALVRDGSEFHVNLQKCGGCGTCEAVCKGSVIQMVSRK